MFSLNPGWLGWQGQPGHAAGGGSSPGPRGGGGLGGGGGAGLRGGGQGFCYASIRVHSRDQGRKLPVPSVRVMSPSRMTPEQARRLTLAEQHEWYRRLTSRRTLLRGGVAGAGALVAGPA